MADLSSLSPEQLEAYKSILYRKVSSQQEMQGPGQMKVNLPDELTGKPETLKEQWNPTSSKFWIPEEFRKDIPQGIEAMANGRYAPGTTLLSQGGKRALAPVVAGATLASPIGFGARAVPSMIGSAIGQKVAEKGSEALGANPEQSQAIGEAASWVPFGGLASENLGKGFAGAIKGGAQAAGEQAMSPKSALRGAGLGFTGRGIGEMFGSPHAGEAVAEGINYGIPIVKGAYQGMKDAFKVEAPGGEEIKITPKEKGPLPRQETLDPEVSSKLKEGAKRINPDGTTQVLKKVPLDKIKPEEGNRMYADITRSFKTAGWTVKPELKQDEGGNFTIHEGHHRIAAAKELGNKDTLAWVPEETKSQGTAVGKP